MKIYTLEQIRKIEKDIPLMVEQLEKGYEKYSLKETVVPPVGYLHFDAPAGNTYIKYGYVKGDDSFVIKVFNGFPENAEQNLPTSDGLNLVFDTKTGMTKAILLDEGWLTGFRTAGATLVCAKHLAPKNITKVGICGTGTQAHAILSMTPYVLGKQKVVVYGYTKELTDAFVAEFKEKGFDIEPAYDVQTVCDQCNYIVTATTTMTPIITADMVKPGTHITGVGADAGGKNEIDASVYAKADLVVNDSINQCVEDGDTSFAIKKGAITKDKIIELGTLIHEGKGRENDEQNTVADLTGIAVQDIIAAEMACQLLGEE